VRRLLVVLALLAGAAALLSAAPPAWAARPARVTLDGEWQIDRSQHDACFVAVPPLITGRMHLEADFEAGTVVGWLDGQGSGSYTVPAECKHENPDDYDRWNLETWDAEFTLIQGEFSGDLDPVTGQFEVNATIAVEAGVVRDAPDAQWMCGTDDWTDTCVYSYEWEDPGTLSGTVSGTGVNRGAIDWYAPFCAAMSPGHVTWTDEGCPHEGQWEGTVTEVVWSENRPPRIQDVTVEPSTPREGEPVTLTAVAHDPDDDRLAFHWTVDGAVQGATGASLRLMEASAGDYWVELVVEDGQGGRAETSLGFTVVAVPPPASEAAETTTTTTTFGDDPLASPDQEETAADEEAAAPDDQWAMWGSGSSGLPQGAGLVVLIFAVLAGVFSASLLVGYLVRLRMGWGRQEAAEDTLLAEGLTPPIDETVPSSWFEVLREGQYQQQGGRPEPGWMPPGMREPPHVSGVRKTPTAYHQAQPGLKPGRYRWVELHEPVYLEKPIPGGGVELISTEYYGGLVGEPDPSFPGHSPAYGQHGERIGWVRTADLPK
jgi:hypothetical protein